MTTPMATSMQGVETERITITSAHSFSLAPDFPSYRQTTVIGILAPKGSEPLALHFVHGVDIQIANEVADSSLALLKITEKDKPIKYQLRRVTRKETPDAVDSSHLITKDDPVIAEIIEVDDRFFINPQACTALNMEVTDAGNLPLYAKISGIIEKGQDDKGKPKDIETPKDKWATLICLGNDAVTGSPVYLYHDWSGERRENEKDEAFPGRAAKLYAQFIPLRPEKEEDIEQPRKSRFSATSVQMKPGMISDPETKSKDAKMFAEAAAAREMLTVFPLALPPVPKPLFEKLNENVVVRETTTITVDGTSKATTVSITHRLPILFTSNKVNTKDIKPFPLQIPAIESASERATQLLLEKARTQERLKKIGNELIPTQIAATVSQPILLRLDYQPLYHPFNNRATIYLFDGK